MKRHKHSKSHFHNTTHNMGAITPIACYEVLPGDTVQMATSALIRCSPLIAPVMHPMHAKIHHFFVPTRILWDDFEDFITRGPDGTSAPAVPTIAFPSGIAEGSLANYLGLPVTSAALTGDGAISALPFRAYAEIFNEYFRDQDLVDPVGVDYSSGIDSITNKSLLSAAWEKDRYTAARPFTQKGPSVSVPLAGDAPIKRNSTQPIVTLRTGADTVTERNWNVAATTGAMTASGAPAASSIQFGNYTGLIADLSSVSGIQINELRAALSLQRWQEHRAQFGSRYTEYLRFLGIRSSDGRLQRPEYLGGGKSTIQFSEVLGSVNNDDTTLGQLGGHGIGNLNSNRFRYFAEEHGYIISVVTIRPIAIYADGIPKMWHRQTFMDYWQKEFEQIGQQPIQNREVYAAASDPDGTFGYNDPYNEYRSIPSRVSAEFATTLKDWNVARIFASEPVLNDDFVTCTPDPRIFASLATDQFYSMFKHSIQVRSLLSHFQGNRVL